MNRLHPVSAFFEGVLLAAGVGVPDTYGRVLACAGEERAAVEGEGADESHQAGVAA